MNFEKCLKNNEDKCLFIVYVYVCMCIYVYIKYMHAHIYGIMHN